MADWYVNFGNGSSTGYYAVTQYANLHLYAVGDIVRQLATPAVGSERCFRCTTLGTSGASEPSWNLAKAATTTAGTAIFTEITGNSIYNWSAPHARQQIATGNGWSAAGDNVYVAKISVETAAAAINSPGTSVSVQNSLINVICVDSTGSVPPVSANLGTGASVSATTSNQLFLFNLTGGASYYRGISFSSTANSGLATTGASYIQLKFEACNFTLANNAANTFQINNATQGGLYFVEWVNTTITFSNVGQYIFVCGGMFTWRNTVSAVLGTVPTVLFNPSAATPGPTVIICEGVDLSAVNTTIFGASSNGAVASGYLINCRLNASVTVAATPLRRGEDYYLINCDSGATGYRNEKYNYDGTLKTETTIVRSGGAIDTSGGTSYSHKITTTANCGKVFPFAGLPFDIWVDITGSSKTATIEMVNDGTTFTGADLWFEAEYLGNASYPLGSMATSGIADILAVGTSYSTSSETWTTTGLSSPVKQYAQITFTTQIKGYVRITPKVAKVSKTLYICPKVAVA